LDTMG